jgi:hypothetical protein
MGIRMDFVYWVVAALAEPLWLANEPISEIGYGQGEVTAVTVGQTSLSTVHSKVGSSQIILHISPSSSSLIKNMTSIKVFYSPTDALFINPRKL